MILLRFITFTNLFGGWNKDCLSFLERTAKSKMKMRKWKLLKQFKTPFTQEKKKKNLTDSDLLGKIWVQFSLHLHWNGLGIDSNGFSFKKSLINLSKNEFILYHFITSMYVEFAVFGFHFHSKRQVKINSKLIAFYFRELCWTYDHVLPQINKRNMLLTSS